MRETPGLSVCPTVSDSMLKFLRRNRDATRFSTPGLSSTRMTRVCCMSLLHFVGGHLDQPAGPANHFVQVGTGGYHRVNAVFLLDAEVDHHRAIRLLGRMDR